MFLFNKKMMSDDNGSGGSGGSEPSKGTYAYDETNIDTIRAMQSDADISFAVVSGVPTENTLTYLVSDHFVETDDPDAEKQIITNHDYILEVTSAKDAAVRAGKETFDANAREAIAAKFNDTETTSEPLTPSDPSDNENSIT